MFLTDQFSFLTFQSTEDSLNGPRGLDAQSLVVQGKDRARAVAQIRSRKTVETSALEMIRSMRYVDQLIVW